MRHDLPALLLLHGLPSSSRMFEPLFARLSDRFHLVAPDYPGFGHSDWPDPKAFAYTFDHLAEIVNHFTEALGLSRYTLYMQDYGGPVGFRMALAHPDRVEALIVQDAVAHEGLGANWGPRRVFWADRAANESTVRTNLLSLASTRTRHVGSDPNVDRGHVFHRASHRQDDAELCVTAQHACVSLGCFSERICFDHRTHGGQFGEAQGVLGIGWCSRGPALNRSASGNELYRCDLNGIKCHADHYELAVRPQTVDQFGHRLGAWGCR